MTIDEIKEMVSANTGIPKSLEEQIKRFEELGQEATDLEEKDNINPDHYKNSTSLECIEAMLLVFGKKAVVDFCECNAWKYIWRWKHKNGLEDLEKAKWYVKKAVELDPTTYNVLLDRMRDYIEVNNCPEQDGDK